VLEGRRGAVRFDVRVAPRFDYGEVRPWIRRHRELVHSAIGGNDALIVFCEQELQESPDHELAGRVTVGAGERIRLSLRYCAPELVERWVSQVPDPGALDAGLEQTVAWWREWSRGITLAGSDEEGVRRSAIVLKALTYKPTGAIVAAATTSLPEAIGGTRNWDYRYAWVRDASFSSRAFAELGSEEEADAFRAFVMRSAAGQAEDLQVLYGVGGERRLRAAELPALEGYRRCGPARVGNDAASQRQLDAYGELVNLTWRWHRRGQSPNDDDWRFLVSLIDHAARQAGEPDHGVWEWAGEPEHFVHSKVLCWAALERGLRLADECLRVRRRGAGGRPVMRCARRSSGVAMTASAVFTCRHTAAATSMRRCCCCRRSSTSTGVTSAYCGRSPPCAGNWTQATGCCTATGARTGCPAMRGHSCAVRSGWSSASREAARSKRRGRCLTGRSRAPTMSGCSQRRLIRQAGNFLATSPRGSRTWRISMLPSRSPRPSDRR